jgi:N-methylhydantoinase B
MTNTLNTPIEAIEYAYPLRVTRYEVRQNSGGEGRFHGGDGIVRELELLADAEVTILSERRRFAPYGLASGASAKVGRNVLVHGDAEEDLLGKVSRKLARGDRIRIETPGGGGHGSKPGSD